MAQVVRGNATDVRHDEDAGTRLAVQAGLNQHHGRRGITPNVARLMLLCCAALWGGSYVVAKFVMGVISPQYLMAMRTGGACLIMLALFHKRILPAFNRHVIWPALLVGCTYWIMMVCQMVGLKTIDPGRSAFLTAAYCVLTPFAGWLILRRRPGLLNVVAAVICLVGVGFVALNPVHLSLTLSSGDVLTLVGAVAVSFNLTLLGIFSRRIDPIAITFMQFLVSCLLFTCGALVSEPLPSVAWLEPKVVGGFLYLVLGATTLAQIMQNIGLKQLSAPAASILMCTESLFAQLFSTMFGMGHLDGTTIIGFVFIFAAVLLSIVRRDMLVAAIHYMGRHFQRV